MENKVYVVLIQEFDGDEIFGIFSEKDKAEAYTRMFDIGSGIDFSIEEYILNPFSKEMDNGLKCYFVRMSKEGEVIELRLSCSYVEYDIDDAWTFDINKNMRILVFAKDVKHAIKIADERRIKLIAEDKWRVDKK